MSAEASSSSSSISQKTTPIPTPAPLTASDIEIEKLLNREATAFQREVEVERILKAFKLNPYDILDISESSTPEEVKRRYRQLSLFIHPDKTAHARAPEAFDILKKAEGELSDAAKRADLDAIISQARTMILKELALPLTLTDDDSRLKKMERPTWKERMRLQCKDLLIDEEVRRRKAIKMNLANEGLEARKKDEEVSAKKRKAEEDKNWEERREERVDSWRSFSKGGKKKKAKINILG